MKFHQNSSNGRRVVPCGQTDMTKLVVAFRNFANTPKNPAVCNMLNFVMRENVSFHPTPELDDHLLLAIRDSLNMLTIFHVVAVSSIGDRAGT